MHVLCVTVQYYRRGFIVAGTTMFFCDTNPYVSSLAYIAYLIYCAPVTAAPISGVFRHSITGCGILGTGRASWWECGNREQIKSRWLWGEAIETENEHVKDC